jgi:hypothetical protein
MISNAVVLELVKGCRPLLRACFAAAVAWILSTTPCAARENVTAFDGGPSTGEGFVQPILSLALNGANSLVVRPTASYTYYDTRDSAGAVDTTSPEASFGIGYRYTGGKLVFDIGPAFEVLSQEHKTLIGKTTDQMLMGAAFATHLYYQATPFVSINVAANYDEANGYSWSHAAIKQRLTDLDFQDVGAFLLGADVTEQGNSAVRQLSAGGLLEFAFGKGETALQFRAGCAWLDFAGRSGDAGAYAGLTLSQHF